MHCKEEKIDSKRWLVCVGGGSPTKECGGSRLAKITGCVFHYIRVKRAHGVSCRTFWRRERERERGTTIQHSTDVSTTFLYVRNAFMTSHIVIRSYDSIHTFFLSNFDADLPELCRCIPTDVWRHGLVYILLSYDYIFLLNYTLLLSGAYPRPMLCSCASWCKFGDEMQQPNLTTPQITLNIYKATTR